MRESSIRMQYRQTSDLDDLTQHGLLATLYQFAQSIGFFQHWDEMPLKMKTVVHSPSQKFITLWASILAGCQHTSDINCKLGADEKSLASLLGLLRFPDQSQINRLLKRFTPEFLDWFRAIHFELLCSHTLTRLRSLWLRLANGKRVLTADLDQRAIAVRGKQFELAEKGYFGRHRGHRGFRLSLLFLGGSRVGEVLDEHLDPGNIYMRSRTPDLLERLAEFCRRKAIGPNQVLLRGDAELGTPYIIELAESYRFRYLFKGLSAQRAENLASEVKDDSYLEVKPSSEGSPRWMCDLGSHIHRDHSETGAGRTIECRTLVMRSVQEQAAEDPQVERKRRKHTGRKKTEERKRRQTRYDYFLTNLGVEELPVERVLEVYDDRATIESYFGEEQNALGAKHIRTGSFAGSAVFQYLVATTNNLLKWFRHLKLKGSEFEGYGLKRIIHQLMQIPARLIRRGKAWTVEFSRYHAQAAKLLKHLNAQSP